MRATALPPDERRSAIVGATLPLLVEHGDRVTTRQIADAAGVAEGTIFRVFDDKDAVITAVVEAACDPAPLEAALGAIDLDQDLETVLEAAVAILQERVVNIWRLLSSVGTRFHEHARRPMTDSDALTALFDRYRAALAVSPAQAARLLRALTLSLTHPMLAGEPMAPRELVQFFLHGVARPSPASTAIAATTKASRC